MFGELAVEVGIDDRSPLIRAQHQRGLGQTCGCCRGCGDQACGRGHHGKAKTSELQHGSLQKGYGKIETGFNTLAKEKIQTFPP
jgi:hypothetical protein